MHIKSILLSAALGLGMISVLPVSAQQDGGDELGRLSYNAYCSVCHGEMGAGAGSLSGLLKVEIADLTHLSERNHGEFPMLKVIHIIDGRSGTRGHNGPMPIFGKMFDTGQYGPYGAETIIRGQVLSIALYLESIQK